MDNGGIESHGPIRVGERVKNASEIARTRRIERKEAGKKEPNRLGFGKRRMISPEQRRQRKEAGKKRKSIALVAGRKGSHNSQR